MIRRNKRSKFGIIIESAEPREPHHFSMLFGYGASAINPYLVNEVISYYHSEGKFGNNTIEKSILNYNKAIANGVLKIMKKIGISTLNSYRGSQIFEALGLGDDLRRARDGRKIRAGKATMRGRVHKTPKSVLLVVANKDGLAKAARNLPGVDVVAAKDLSAEDLAPGGDMGRLTVFTAAAVEALN